MKNLICLTFLLVASSIATAQNSSSSDLYLGSPQTKLYYSFQCDEAKKLNWGFRLEFATPEAAEKAGYKLGECTITRLDREDAKLFDAVYSKREGPSTDAGYFPDGGPETFFPSSDDCSGKVVGITDGDTVTILNSGNREVKVRLAGIDAPESGQGFGQAAKSHLSSLIFGQQVQCESTKKDAFGRIIGKLLQNGDDVNLRMVRDCMAWHYKKYEGEQSASDRSAYAVAETSARGGRCGLWAASNPISPAEFRLLGSTDASSGTSYGPTFRSSSSTPTGGPVRVRSYTRRDGTVVRSHTRSRPRN